MHRGTSKTTTHRLRVWILAKQHMESNVRDSTKTCFRLWVWL